MKKALLFLLLLSLSFSATCTGSYRVPVLAVSSDQGDVVYLNLTLEKGSGVFADSLVRIGEGLPESLRDAYFLSDKECAYVVDFPDELKEVRGPSGGLTFAVWFKLLPEEKPPSDVAFSGAIDKDGNVYPVGGTLEKALAAQRQGFRRVFLPYPNRLEYFLFTHSSLNVDVYFVSSVQEVLSLLKGAKYSFNDSYLFNSSLRVPNTSPSVKEFEEGYKLISTLYAKELERLKGQGRFYDFYLQQLNASERVAEKGFYYSAANNLFNLYGEVFALSRALDGREEEYVRRVEECLNTPLYAYGWDNFEYIAGAKIRKERARKALEKYKEERHKTAEERLYALYNLGNAYAWCKLAESLNRPSKELISKEEMDRLRDMAKEKVRELNYSLDLVKPFVEGDYILSLYQWAYSSNASVGGEGGFWYYVYVSQSQYLNLTGDGKASEDVLALAKRLSYVRSLIFAQRSENRAGEDGFSGFLDRILSFFGGWFHGRGKVA